MPHNFMAIGIGNQVNIYMPYFYFPICNVAYIEVHLDDMEQCPLLDWDTSLI